MKVYFRKMDCLGIVGAELDIPKGKLDSLMSQSWISCDDVQSYFSSQEELLRVFESENYDSKRFKVLEYPSLYDALIGDGLEVGNHCSDLYVVDTPRTRKLVADYGLEFEVFVNQITKQLNLSVRFQYLPWWKAKEEKQRQKD